MNNGTILVISDTAFLKTGQLCESYRAVDGGVEVDGKFLAEGSYMLLTEQLSPSDEARVRDICRQLLKGFIWKMYSNQNMLIPN